MVERGAGIVAKNTVGSILILSRVIGCRVPRIIMMPFAVSDHLDSWRPSSVEVDIVPIVLGDGPNVCVCAWPSLTS